MISQQQIIDAWSNGETEANSIAEVYSGNLYKGTAEILGDDNIGYIGWVWAIDDAENWGFVGTFAKFEDAEGALRTLLINDGFTLDTIDWGFVGTFKERET